MVICNFQATILYRIEFEVIACAYLYKNVKIKKGVLLVCSIGALVMLKYLY